MKKKIFFINISLYLYLSDTKFHKILRISRTQTVY